MKKTVLSALLLSLSLALAPVCFAEAPAVKPGDTVQSVLAAQQGKRVTVRLMAGDELTGKVTAVTKELLHLSALAGRDYYDAVIDVGRIQAVIIRTKE